MVLVWFMTIVKLIGGCLKEDFERVRWDCIYLTSDVDDIWQLWKTLFFKTVEQNIPFKFLRKRVDIP